MEKHLEGVVEWLATTAKRIKAKSFVVGISGGVDSAVVAALCKKTELSTIGVLMPCHSSPSSVIRGEEVVKQFGLTRHMVVLDKAFESIQGQMAEGAGFTQDELFAKESAGALRSCLRAPTLDFAAKLYNGLIVGTGNRDEDEVTRYYQKRGDGAVDISPIAKFHKSEVYALAKLLNVPESVIKAVPSADLWGPDAGQEDEKQLGLTYREIEWGIKQAETYAVRSGVGAYDIERRLRNATYLGYNDREIFVLRELARMERGSQHKRNTVPYYMPIQGMDHVPPVVEEDLDND